MTGQFGEVHVKFDALLKCGFCGWREPAQEARAGIDNGVWFRSELERATAGDPPPVYRCRSCGRLRYVDESLELERPAIVGVPPEPLEVA